VSLGRIVVGESGTHDDERADDGDSGILELAAHQLCVERGNSAPQVAQCRLAKRLPEDSVVDGGSEEEGEVQVRLVVEDPADAVALGEVKVDTQL
jgi:hypothetical protein